MDHPDTPQHGFHFEGQSEGKSPMCPSQLPAPPGCRSGLLPVLQVGRGEKALPIPWPGVVYSHIPPSVVQPPSAQEAIPVQEEELPPPQLPIEKKGERLPIS